MPNARRIQILSLPCLPIIPKRTEGIHGAGSGTSTLSGILFLRSLYYRKRPAAVQARFAVSGTERNSGRILTTDYLAFSDPKALNTLLDLKNIELRMYCCQKQENPSDSVGFHTKGYFFEEDDQCCMIISSSNLTDAALCTNEEWNTRLITSRKGSFYTECMNAFESLYTSPQTVLYRDYAREYEEIVRIACASHPFQPVRQGLSHPLICFLSPTPCRKISSNGFPR